MAYGNGISSGSIGAYVDKTEGMAISKAMTDVVADMVAMRIEHASSLHSRLTMLADRVLGSEPTVAAGGVSGARPEGSLPLIRGGLEMLGEEMARIGYAIERLERL